MMSCTGQVFSFWMIYLSLFIKVVFEGGKGAGGGEYYQRLCAEAYVTIHASC